MSVLDLSREHPSIFRAPILRQVDSRIFTLRYFTHCMECGFCRDQCCTYGVDIDEENAGLLRSLGQEFEQFVGTSGNQWFTDEPTDDAEFPSGRHRRTVVRNGHCVFHGAGERGCKIHAWCLRKGLDYHHYKPMVSILFPLTFNFGRLEPSHEAIDGTLICSGGGPTLYDGVRSELQYFFGDSLIEELDRLRNCNS
ncbi:MAG TPA: hypothetical protein VG819_13980 [Rhizomicrobium sp.]|jgi:hypothetical protein|nr:hypothetical protein [Rhizomicrobium sp.]